MKADLHNHSFLSDGVLSIDDILYYSKKINSEEVKIQIKYISQKYDSIMAGGTDFHGYYSSTRNPIGSFTCPEGKVEKLIRLIKRMDL